MGHYIIGSVVLVCALFVMMATLVLRYHYISDFIAALVISVTAIAISSLFYENKKEVSEVDVSDLLKENGKLEMDIPVDTSSYMTE
jgi:membrane-associated phospholipid phosphatase